MKKELQQRIEMRSKMTEQEKREQRFPSFPKELQDSPIHSAWQKYIVLPIGDFQPTRPDRITPATSTEKRSAKKPKLIDDLDPVHRDRIKNAWRILDEAKKRRRQAAEVPDNTVPEDEQK